MARVMPTNMVRRSRASISSRPSPVLEVGMEACQLLSRKPARATMGNSSPFAACSVKTFTPGRFRSNSWPVMNVAGSLLPVRSAATARPACVVGQNQPEVTDDEFDADWAATARALDDLLVEFIEQGHKPEMSERLRKIVYPSLIGFYPEEIYILPGDQDGALSSIGNPLIDYDAYESEEEAEANAPVFDWNNPEHCAALKERILEYGC